MPGRLNKARPFLELYAGRLRARPSLELHAGALKGTAHTFFFFKDGWTPAWADTNGSWVGRGDIAGDILTWQDGSLSDLVFTNDGIQIECAGTCKLGHALIRFRTSASKRCSAANCRLWHPNKSGMYGCHKCGHYLCITCANYSDRRSGLRGLDAGIWK
eukprot:gene11459-biopygen7516